MPQAAAGSRIWSCIKSFRICITRGRSRQEGSSVEEPDPLTDAGSRHISEAVEEVL